MPYGEGDLPAVSGTTRLYGIMGYPVAHSWSPRMHTLAFRHHGLDCLYMPFPVRPEHLPQAVAGAIALGVGGFNVTIPHKETVMACLDRISSAAQFIGAVNTVMIEDGQSIGYNTDGEGFLQPLRALPQPLTALTACILGAGGAARAITMALLEAGCPVLAIANRTPERSARLADALRARFPQADVRTVPFDGVAAVAKDYGLLVNATAVGLHHDDACLLPSTCFQPGQLVYDIVYRPLHTPFLQAAQRCGATVIPGLDMLIGQGAVAFHIWTGLTFPVAEIRQMLQPLLHTPTL